MKGKEILATVMIIILLLALIGSCSEESEYEKAGKNFGTWARRDPKTWSDTEKEYFNNFMDWEDKN